MKDVDVYCDGIYVEDDYVMCYKRQTCARWLYSKQYLSKRKSHVCDDENKTYSHYVMVDDNGRMK